MSANETFGAPGPQARFDPQRFSAMLNTMGLAYRWSRAVECPCRANDVTGQWDPTCTRCSGDGWWYVDPCAQANRGGGEDFAPVQAIFSTVGNDSSIIEEFGAFEHGDAVLTVQASHRVAYRDRFTAVEQESAYKELLIRGEGSQVLVGKTGRPRAVQLTALRYEPVRVNFLADADGTLYFAGLDFHLAPHASGVQRLSWLDGRGPAVGDLYTIHYDFRPVWIVDSGVFKVQNSRGPAAGLTGRNQLQMLPTTFKVRLDYLTPAR